MFVSALVVLGLMVMAIFAPRSPPTTQIGVMSATFFLHQVKDIFSEPMS